MTQKRTPEEIAADKREAKSLVLESVDGFYRAYMDRAKTGERKAYIKAIEEVGQALFFALVLIGDEAEARACDHMRCFDWFTDLAPQLEDLNSGTVSATLRCVRSNMLGTDEWMRRLGAVTAVEVMRHAGKTDKAAARRTIAKMPELQGTSEKEVLSWCAEFRKGRVKNARAREGYRDFMEPMSSLDVKTAKIWARSMFNDDGQWGYQWGYPRP
jgi:hypothetical protein